MTFKTRKTPEIQEFFVIRSGFEPETHSLEGWILCLNINNLRTIVNLLIDFQRKLRNFEFISKNILE